MNVALKAVHDALRSGGDPEARWQTFAKALGTVVAPVGVAGTLEVEAALKMAGVRGTAFEWTSNLRFLGVLDPEGHVDYGRAESVGEAIGLAADSFAPSAGEHWWAPVATLPLQLRSLLNPPPIRQTAGVLLELVDAALSEIILAAPFVDGHAVEFLATSLLSAGARGVALRVITSAGQSASLAQLVKRWPARSPGTARVTEVVTEMSGLGSHAKVLVVDRARAYVGSANLTGAGLGRHVEIGVELAGSQVGELVRVFVALEQAGRLVVEVGGDRR